MLFENRVEPHLHAESGVVMVYHFPCELAALAELGVDENQINVAKRFEVYGGGMELANGFCECTDGQEQRKRFEADQKQREAAGQLVPEIDGVERAMPMTVFL